MRYHKAGIIQHSWSLIKRKTKTAIPLFILLAICLTSYITMAVFASTPVFAAPAIETDQPEYMEGETAYIFGSGFTPNSQVIVQVIRVDNSIVTGNGTETPGSDIITVDPLGSFIYPYWLFGGTTAQYYGTLTVNAIDTATLATLATTTFLDNPSFGLQGCSRYRGDCTDSATPATGWADGTNPMNGWTSGNVKGWYELEDVPYRLKVKLKYPSDAKIYYITTEHDNLRDGVTGVDSAGGFYVGAGDDDDINYNEGELTKTCVFQAYRTTAPADLPTPSNPCIVTGPTYSGVDDDGNNGIDEDAANGADNDADGKIDEDPPPKSSSPGVRRIQYTWAVLFESSDVGNDKKWALYWKAHLASGSSNWPGASLHAQTSAGGSQDVPIQNVLASQQADLSISKTDSPDPVTVGGTLTYNITVTNNGPSSASNVTVTDTIPGSTTFVSASSSLGSCSGTSTVICNLGSLANGSSATVTIVVTPNTAGTISNKASVTSSTSDPTSSNNTTPWVYTTVNSPPSNTADLSINKTDSPDPVPAGGILTYTITVTNIGPNPATNVTVTDNLPGGVTNINASGTGWNCIMSGYLVTCSRANLSVGSPSVITITVNAPSSGCNLNNTASVTADQNDPDNSNNTKTITTTVAPGANLSITKTAFPDPVTAGGILTYTVTVGNTGPSSATNVIVTDTLPAGTAFIGASGTGWSCSHSAGVVSCNRASLGVTTAPAISIQVTAPAEGGTISNTATVISNVNDANTGNNSTGSVVTVVTASTDLSITKTDAPDPVYSGQNLNYTITVTNNGPSTASNVSVTDTLPSGVTYGSATGTGWTCSHSAGVVTCTRGTLAAGAAPDITIVVTAPATAGTIYNSATVSTSTNDPVSGNNTTIVVSTTVNASADLTIIKTDSPDPVTAGAALTFTLAVTNNGPSTASTVTVSDTLPSGVTYVSATGTGWTCGHAAGVVTCTRATLATGAAPNINIVVTAPAAPGTLNNSATVSAATYDPNSGNNTSSSSTTVNASTDLSITKTDSPDPVTQGGTLTYTITVLNSGPSTATGVTVTDTLPGSVSLVSASPSQGSACTGTTTVSCNLGTLANGASATVTIVVTPNTAGTISNSASVSSSTTDPVSSNNTTLPVSTTVNPPPSTDADLSISKSDSPDPVTAGGTLTYTITVTNLGPNPANNITVTDTLPAGVSNVSAGGTGWTCNVVGLSVTCTRTTLAVATAPVITITMNAPSEGGTITNTASVAATENDPNGSNNTTLPVSTTVSASSDLTITKTGSPATVTAGGTVTYTVTAVNNGPSTATGVQVTDTLPSGVTFVSAAGSGWTCPAPVGLVVTCNLGSSLAVGSAPAISITVTVPTTGGSITNNASVSGSVADPNSGNNNTSASTTVTALADLSITNIDSPDPVYAGESLTYTMTVTNNGPSTATNITVLGNLPPGTTYVSAVGSGWTCNHISGVVTCTRPSLTSGSTAPAITVTMTAPATAGSSGSTTTVSSTESDPIMANNTATVNTAVTASANLSITKTDSPDPLLVGQNLTYAITVTNNGPSSAANVTMNDTLPAGVNFVSSTPSQGSCSGTSTVSCNLGSIISGGNATVSIVVTPTAAGTLTNSATASSTTYDPNVANNNTGNITTTVNALPASDADLSITKTDAPDPVYTGQNLTYTITVTNNGPSTATGVTMTDTLPSAATYVSSTPSQGSCLQSGVTVTCTIGILGNGASATVAIVVKPTTAGTISNSAVVSGDQTDSVTGNNSTGPVNTTVNPSTDLSVTKTDSPDPVPLVGSNLTYTITVTNNGPGAATGVTVTDTMPSTQVSFVSITTTLGSCTGTTTINCSIGSLSNGGSATVTIVVQTLVATMVSNTANVSGNEFDSNSVNNSATAVTNVGDLSKLINISTRGMVLTDDRVMIGGFILGGLLPKTVLISGSGPTLADWGVSGSMADPYIELYSGQTLFATNDDWQTPVAQCNAPATSCGTPQDIQATGKSSCSLATTGCTRDAAILVTLPPGAYTAILRGVGGGTGVGIVGVDDPDTSTAPKLVNISTRGMVLTGDSVMIGGFIIGAGNGNKRVMVQATGPTLADFGVTGAMADPYVELYSGQTRIATNDNWQTQITQCDPPAVSCGTPQDIQATGKSSCSLATTGCTLDAAILVTLPPGAYTAIVRGVNGGTGVGLVGIDELGQ